MGIDDTDRSHPQPTETSEVRDAFSTKPGEVIRMPGPLPERIGQYRVKRMIAAGGMGIVYEALQEHPRRTVALKVMKHGVTSPSALRRFEYESQVLARLRHPGIAQIYEAGTHDDGTGSVPYFAMEYIPNAKPITDYAKERQLRPRERLDLFARVCEAVHHGHQKGIIHRDLKPGNLLVDSCGEVKIIDFGVARGTDSDMAVATLQTDIGQLLGTLQYMSPEQCDADPHDLDTRSDVYALGVVLYELLSGKLPYEVKKKPLIQSTRVIRDEQPERLSVVDVALKGDPETVVFKALEKDRNRRYQSALELARDIRRYLADEAIVARPPSVLYQFRLFARRNRAVFNAIAIAFVVLLAGIAVSTHQAIRATRAERLAERKAAVAESTIDFLTQNFILVVAPGNLGPEAKVREAVDAAQKKLGAEFADKPLEEAEIRLALAEAYWALGEYQTGEHHAAEAYGLRRGVLGERDRHALRAAELLAMLYKYRGRYDEAEELYVKTLNLRRNLLGRNDRDTLESMIDLAVLRRVQGRWDEAEALYREAVPVFREVLGDEHPDTLHAVANFGALLRGKGELADEGKLDEAEDLTREALETRLRVLGEEDPYTLQSMNNLARLLIARGILDEAEQWSLRALNAGRRVFGSKHRNVAILLRNRAKVLNKKGDYRAAEPLLREAQEISCKLLGDDHDQTLHIMIDLGCCLGKLEKFKEAEELLRESFDRASTVGNERRSLIRQAAEALVDLYEACGESEQAARWRRRLVPAGDAAGDGNDPP